MKKNRHSQNNKISQDPFVCLCNEIPLSKIEAAIGRGCNTLNKVAAATTAGAGQCGGSCQPKILKIIERIQGAAEPQSKDDESS